MLRFIGERALHAVVVVVLATIGAFFLMEAVPGDSAASAVGPGATEEQYLAAREELGLDDPLAVRFAEWAGSTLSLDLGNSLILRLTCDSRMGTQPLCSLGEWL